MTDEIREKLSLSRAGKSGSLAPWEREQIERDPLLHEEVELNEVLERINLETRTSPPPMNSMLDQARHSARARSSQSRQNAFFQRLQWYIEKKLPWTTPQLVLRTALLVAVLIIWPMILNGVGILIKRANSHVVASEAAETFQLTYAIQVPTEAGSPAPEIHGDGVQNPIPDVIRGAEAVCSEMMMRFTDWSERYPELSKYTSYHSYISYEDLFREQYEGLGEIGVVQIDIRNEDGEVLPDHLRELAQLFDEMPEVGECIVRVGTTEDRPIE